MKKIESENPIKVIVKNPLKKDQMKNRLKELNEFLSKCWYLKIDGK